MESGDIYTNTSKNRRGAFDHYTKWLLFSFPALVVLFIIYHLIISFTLSAKLDECRKSGYPTTHDEYQIWVLNGYKNPEKYEPVPVNLNAALYVQSASRLAKNNIEDVNMIQDVNVNRDFLSVIGNFNDKLCKFKPLPENVMRNNQEILDVNQPYFDAMNEALTKPYLMPTNPNPDNWRYANYNLKTNPFVLAFYMAALENNPDESVEYFRKLNTIAKWLRKGNADSMSKLMSFSRAYLYIPLAMQHCDYSNSQLRTIKEFVRNSFSDSQFKIDMMRNEIGWILYLSSTPKKRNLFFPYIKGYPTISSYGRRISYFLARLAGADKITELYTINFFDSLIAANEMENSRERTDAVKSIKPLFLFSKILYNQDLFYYIINKTLAEQRCLIAAISVKQFENKYGKLPNSLDELIPEFIKSIPVNPLDGKKIKYEKGKLSMKIFVNEKIKNIPFSGFSVSTVSEMITSRNQTLKREIAIQLKTSNF